MEIIDKQFLETPWYGSRQAITPFPADLSGKYFAKSVPPKLNGFVADMDAAFMQKILNIANRKCKPNINHDGHTDDIRIRLEVANGATFCHPTTLIARPARLNRICSDSVTVLTNLATSRWAA